MTLNKDLTRRKLIKSLSTAFGLCAGAGILGPAAKAFGEDFPSKPIHVIVPWAVGGGTDIFARGITAVWEKVLGVPMVVVNRPGGNNQVGYEALQAAPGDGYTLVAGQLPNLNVTYMFQKPSYQADSFAWVCLFHLDQQIFYCNKEAPWKDLGQVIDYVRQNPGKLDIGTTSRGWHMYFPKMLEDKLGIKFGKILPQGGGSALKREIRGGHLQLATHGAWTGRTAAKFARGLGVCSLELSPIWPDTPTWNEFLPEGKKLTAQEIFPTVYKGFAVKREVREKHPQRFALLAQSFKKMMATEDYKKAVAKLAMESVVSYKDPDQAGAEMKRWDEIMTKHKDLFQAS